LQARPAHLPEREIRRNRIGRILPNPPTQFATIETEQKNQNATKAVPFPHRQIEQHCRRSFSVKKSCSSPQSARLTKEMNRKAVAFSIWTGKPARKSFVWTNEAITSLE
jgi:hypothetical protein